MNAGVFRVHLGIQGTSGALSAGAIPHISPRFFWCVLCPIELFGPLVYPHSFSAMQDASSRASGIAHD
jgi:hypothetical protein